MFQLFWLTLVPLFLVTKAHEVSTQQVPTQPPISLAKTCMALNGDNAYDQCCKKFNLSHDECTRVKQEMANVETVTVVGVVDALEPGKSTD